MMSLEPTYKLASEAPPAWPWESYETWLSTTWAQLLKSDEARHEPILQRFLENHPSLLPGAYSFPPSGHAPFPGAVVTQPRLQGIGIKIPDFMWIAFDSATIYPVLIEIETPHKHWFTKKGMSAEFTAAHTQLLEWRRWFGDGTNQQTFIKTFMIPDDYVRIRRFQPQFVLIHGSRQETEENKDLNSLRSQYNTDDISVATFDRLRPDYHSRSFGCVRLEGSAYRLVSIPPTFKNGPWATHFNTFSGREVAIRASELIDPDRKQFLLSRLDYWDSWVKSPGRGIIRSSDCE